MSTPLPDGPTGRSWLSTFTNLPRHIVQPFSLAAVAVVGAVLIAVLDGNAWISIGALGCAVLLLSVGLAATPRRAIAALVGGQTYQPVSDVNAATPVEDSPAGGGLTGIETVYFLHTYVREGGSVGRNRVLPMDYFVDLMTAALIPNHLECMTTEMINHVRRSGRLKEVTTLACPKRGNPILLTAVARELGMESVFVKERPLFGKTIEGIGGRPKVAAVLDDVSSDGDLLVHCAQVMRAAGFAVETALVLIDRLEGDAAERLAKIGVELVPMFRLGDQDLEHLAERGRRHSAQV